MSRADPRTMSEILTHPSQRARERGGLPFGAASSPPFTSAPVSEQSRTMRSRRRGAVVLTKMFMNEIGRQIERLSLSLDSHVDPEIAWIDLSSQLEALRRTYKLRPADFTEAMIDALKTISRLTEDIRNLSFLVEDSRDAKYQEYAHETANALARTAQCFEGMKLGDLAKARVRELRTRIPSLPSEQASRGGHFETKRRAEEMERANTAAKLWSALNAMAPRCPRCGVTMVMRRGRFGDFWGCHGYPECTGTQNLSEAAKNKLISARNEPEIRDAVQREFSEATLTNACRQGKKGTDLYSRQPEASPDGC